MSDEKKYEFKSDFLKKMINDKDDDKGEIKDLRSINFSKVAEFIVSGATDKDIADMQADIASGNVSIGMDAGAINTVLANKDNEKLKKFIKDNNIPVTIDVNGFHELKSQQFDEVRGIGFDVKRVHVNDGLDRAASMGYSGDKYATMIKSAEDMSKAAFSKLKDDASEFDKFKALYKKVILNATYDVPAANAKMNSKKQLISQNMEGFFINKKSICAGTAEALVQLCKLNGIEAQYVQGRAKSKKGEEDHAWVRVKVDGKWYNCDPTWDAYCGGTMKYFMKSDKDFAATHQRQEYKPTYMRNTNGRTVEYDGRNYESADESLDSSLYSDLLSDSEISSKLGGRSLNDLPRFQGGRSIIDIIIDLIFNLGRKDSNGRIRSPESYGFSKSEMDAFEQSSDFKKAREKYEEQLKVEQNESENPKARPSENQPNKDKNHEDGPEL